MELKSNWVNYIDRTHEQIMQSIRSRMPLKCPEITDLTDSNPMMKMAGIYAGIAELLNYYIDSNAEEVYLSTANFYESGLKIAEMLGYKVQLARPAKGAVVFSVDETATTDRAIPTGTELSYNGVKYYTQAPAILKAGEYSVQVEVANRWLSDNKINLVSLGEANEKFELSTHDKMIDRALIVYVNGVEWLESDAFARTTGLDGVYTTGVTLDRKPYIKFGNGDYGKQLTQGDQIEIGYFATDGAEGNAPIGAIMNIESALPITGVVAVSATGMNGGAEYENLNQLRTNVPNAYRTRLRAITLEDFKDLIDIYTSVAQSAVSYDGNLGLTGYIVPAGGGEASDGLLNDLSVYMEDKVPFMTTVLGFKSAGMLEVAMAVSFNAKKGYTKTAVAEEVRKRLLELFKPETQKIRANFFLSDIYETLETTEGVQNSILKSFYIEPFVNSVGNVENTFKGSLKVEANPETAKWTIVMLAANSYQLFRDGKYLADYAVGQNITLQELVIRVDANDYVEGNVFEFFSYNNLIEMNSVQINEYSVLSLPAKNLVIE